MEQICQKIYEFMNSIVGFMSTILPKKVNLRNRNINGILR